MAAKKKVGVKKSQPEYPGDFLSPYNKLNRIGFMRKGIPECAWIEGRKFTARELKALSDWAQKTADYIESQKTT